MPLIPAVNFVSPVFLPAAEVHTAAVIEMETARNHRYITFIKGIHIHPLHEIDKGLDRIGRIEIIFHAQARGRYAATDTDRPVIILCMGADRRNTYQYKKDNQEFLLKQFSKNSTATVMYRFSPEISENSGQKLIIISAFIIPQVKYCFRGVLGYDKCPTASPFAPRGSTASDDCFRCFRRDDLPFRSGTTVSRDPPSSGSPAAGIKSESAF